MLPGIGFFEIVMLGVLALVVVGPRDLPKLLRQVGQCVGHVRRMGNEFQRSFDDLGRELELDELRKEIQAIKRGEVGPVGEITRELTDLEGEVNEAVRDASPVGRAQDVTDDGGDQPSKAAGPGKATSPADDDIPEDAADDSGRCVPETGGR